METIAGYIISEVVAEDRHAVLFRTKRGDGPVMVRAPSREYPSPDDLAKLSYGASIERSLDLPGVVRVREVEEGPGRIAVVMEDFGGRTLRSMLDGRRLRAMEAVRIALEIAKVLGELHKNHVVHNNIEPRNILVHPGTGAVKITNFDIASRLVRDTPAPSSTRRDGGNLTYGSPEQTGRMNRAVDYRTDFYSLGVTFYEMLTGQAPFRAVDPLSLMYSHIALPPAPPGEVDPLIPPAASEIVLKLLAKNAEDRYQSAFGLASDLRSCLAELEAGTTAPGFIPGLHDVSATFRFPQKLYGREVEKELLVDAFERASSGPSELVVVAGYSGVGKSALVNEIHKPIVRLRGAFSSGKFDQLQNAPYSALIAAFRDLIRELLAESEDTLVALRAHLTDAFGSNGQVILDVLPEVALLVGPQPPVPPLGPSESQNRFNLVFQRFVGALAQRERPLAIFLDDLQWADSASLALIQLLLLDGTSRHLLLIGAYRDNEVVGAHPLVLALDELRKGAARVTEITLKPLEIADVTSLVADTLDRRDDAELRGLARLVHDKTGGNPFFVNQFLSSLYDRKLLAFDPERGEWVWSLDTLRDEGITDNVAHLMAERIRRLSERTQQVLKLAACIGASFDLATLAIVSERTPRETATDLLEAVAQGLVLPIGGDYKYVAQGAQGADERSVHYRFLHDRVQEAAYAAIASDSRTLVHLSVGRLMLDSTPEAELDARIFDIVNQLDRGADRIEDAGERRRLAELNLAACRKAKASTAYASALRYSVVGGDLLGEAGWQTSFALRFALARERAECEYLSGNHETAAAAFERLLREARSTEDRAEIYTLQLILHVSRGAHDEAVAVGLEGLRLQGVAIDLSADLLAACVEEEAVLRARIAGRAIPDLANTVDAKGAAHESLVDLIHPLLATAAYKYPLLFQLLSMKLVNLSLERGNVRGSSLGYVTYAMRVGALFHDWTSAHELGKVALALGERVDDARARGLVRMYYGSFVVPWCQPIRASLPHLDHAYVASLETGQLFIAAVSAMHRVAFGCFAGEDLAAHRVRSEKLFDSLRRLRQFDQAFIIAGFVRGMRLLMTASVAGSDAAELQESFILGKLAHFPMGELQCQIVFCQVTFLFGDLDAAMKHAEIAERYLHTSLGHPNETEFRFLRALLYASLPADGPLSLEQRRKVIAEDEERLERWAADNPASFLHKQVLVQAELARLDGDDSTAMSLYERAIDLAAEGEFVQNEAIANELAAKLHLARGRRKVAKSYLVDARYAYSRWGASAKVAELEARYGDLLPRKGADAADRDGDASAAALDLSSVLRASQAISGEIMLDELLKKLMSTLLENAGAQRGLLVLQGESGSVVEARKGSGGNDAITIGGAPILRRTDVAASIFRYVERTGDSVVLGDAAYAGSFQSDPYIVETRPKSILCMPVLRQKRLVGVVYLENGPVANAFTPERCRILELLAAQAAISLENALLYDTLDNRVKERTRELHASNTELERALHKLRETQKQLVLQEKLASLGALTSGIAHELMNPLNFVTNFADLSVSLADDLVGEVGRNRARLDAAAVAALDEITRDLKVNASKICEHGRRADGIVRAMLEHSRTGASEWRETDLNALVRQNVALADQGYSSRLAPAEVNVQTSYDPAIPRMELPPQEIGRALLNLVNNALYAVRAKRAQVGPAFSPIVRVSTHASDEHVEIRVWDNGTGISVEARDKIFTPFFTTKPAGEGTGLGLSISFEIVHSSGGTLRFESEPGEHAEFIVTLPKRRAS